MTNLVGNTDTLDDFINIVNVDGEAIYDPAFLPTQEADEIFTALTQTILWERHTITIYGKTSLIPRLTAYYGDASKAYSYSGRLFKPYPWTNELARLRDKISESIGVSFNSVLLNFYRNGQDSMGWHSDDEPELGINPTIASISVGAPRNFKLKHKSNQELKSDLILENGSLLVMKDELQHNWLHSLPKTMKVNSGRINLTFRSII